MPKQRLPLRFPANRLISSCLILSFILLSLISCNPPESQTYTLSAITPSPALPGQTIFVYGNLPPTAKLLLGTDPLVPTSIQAGLSFTLPEWTLAGTHILTISAGEQTLTGALQVTPRIDQLNIHDNTLSIAGAGWPSSPKADTSVVVDLAGSLLEPILATGQLSIPLPTDLGYGNLTVQVRVNDAQSEIKTLKREAGAVKGTVILPATQSASIEQASVDRLFSLSQNKDLSSFLVYGSGLPELKEELATLPDLVKTEALSNLSVLKLSFLNPETANAAFTRIQTRISEQQASLKLEWDSPIYTGGFESFAVTLEEAKEKQWFLGLMGLDKAWKVTRGKGIVVGVIDTGVVLDHPDLKANLLPGYDFVDGDASPADTAGHGTHVAGLIAANGAVLGTATEAKLLPVRVLEGTSGGSSFTVAQGILWAAGLLDEQPNPNPAQVLNLSLGSNTYSDVIASAIATVQAAGVLVVAATGNAGGTVAYPAALPGVISVTSLAGPEIPYQPWYANKGRGTWLTAYGGDTTQDQNGDGQPDGILSTDLGGYSLRMGTSMASPQVAGLAALALASGLKAEQVAQALAGTATELGTMGYDRNFGYGLVSGRAVTGLKPRLYVLASTDKDLRKLSEIKVWSLVQDDLRFELGNLPPATELYLFAASDDGDGLLAEKGELISNIATLKVASGQLVESLRLNLHVSNGN